MTSNQVNALASPTDDLVPAEEGYKYTEKGSVPFEEEKPAPTTGPDTPPAETSGQWKDVYAVTPGGDRYRACVKAFLAPRAVSPDEQAECDRIGASGGKVHIIRAAHFSHPECPQGIDVDLRGVAVSLSATRDFFIVTASTPFTAFLANTKIRLFPATGRTNSSHTFISQRLVISCEGGPARIKSLSFNRVEDSETPVVRSAIDGIGTSTRTTVARANCFAPSLSISTFGDKLRLQGHLQTNLLCITAYGGNLAIPHLTSKVTHVTTSGFAVVAISLGTVGQYHGTHFSHSKAVVPIGDDQLNHTVDGNSVLVYVRNRGTGERVVIRCGYNRK